MCNTILSFQLSCLCDLDHSDIQLYSLRARTIWWHSVPSLGWGNWMDNDACIQHSNRRRGFCCLLQGSWDYSETGLKHFLGCCSWLVFQISVACRINFGCTVLSSCWLRFRYRVVPWSDLSGHVQINSYNGMLLESSIMVIKIWNALPPELKGIKHDTVSLF